MKVQQQYMQGAYIAQDALRGVSHLLLLLVQQVQFGRVMFLFQKDSEDLGLRILILLLLGGMPTSVGSVRSVCVFIGLRS